MLGQIVRILVKSTFVLIFMLALLIGLASYANWSAERDARLYCDSIPLSADIRSEIVRFEKHIGYVPEPGGDVSFRHYGYPQKGIPEDGHTFLFIGFIFDKAYCDVTLDANGKVTAKNSYFLYD